MLSGVVIPVITSVPNVVEDVDLVAARLQLMELEHEVTRAMDARFAMQMFLADSGNSAALATALADVSPEAQEVELLQEQMNNLQSVITAAEDQQTALGLVDTEESMQAASLQLADALQAQEQWDATVLRPHDGALARAIAACDEREWVERGDWIENPLDTSARPWEPSFVVGHNNRDVGPSSSNRRLRAGISARQPGPFSAADTSAAAEGHRQAAQAQAHVHGQHGSSSNSGRDGASCSRHASGPQMQCAICFESHAVDTMLAAYKPLEAVTSSAAAAAAATGRCQHLFCRDCMRGYVRCEVQSRKYPIHCPDPGCHLELGVDDITRLLADDTQQMQLFEYLVAEHLIDTARRVYCPYKDCSVLLERPDPEEELVDAAGTQEAPYECPSCKRCFCLACGIAGWHTGLTCQQFQALPPELRSAEDAAVHHIARSKLWKRCPARGCGHMVERSEGCNHMHCICGCSFCYGCGAPYTDTQPTPDNVHGTPGCTCALFNVPAEEEQLQQQQPQPQQQENYGGGYAGGYGEHAAAWDPPPVVLHQANPRRVRPWRNGRFVSRTRCRHSDSIHDCPNGPGRCWFTHDEDLE